MLDYTFVTCSQRVGTIREIGPITHRQLIITMYGSWIPEDDADILVNREYPVYCPASQKMVLRPNVIYFLEPDLRQLQLKPVE